MKRRAAIPTFKEAVKYASADTLIVLLNSGTQNGLMEEQLLLHQAAGSSNDIAKARWLTDRVPALITAAEDVDLPCPVSSLRAV